MQYTLSSLTAMGWVVFSYSLPSKASSSPRVALWRRLQRLGAITPKAGVYVLPDRDECVEAFQWLAQEVRSEEHTSELQSLAYLVCRLLLEKKKIIVEY